VYSYFVEYQNSSARLARTQPISQWPLVHSLQPLDTIGAINISQN